MPDIIRRSFHYRTRSSLAVPNFKQKTKRNADYTYLCIWTSETWRDRPPSGPDVVDLGHY